MKKLIAIFLFIVTFNNISYSQYFQGTISIKNSSTNTVAVKIRPNATITTTIDFIQFFIRYKLSAPLTITNVAANTTTFPGLTFTQGNAVPGDPSYQYISFLYSSTIPAATYTGGTEYELMTFNVDIPTALGNLELPSDFSLAEYYFTLSNAGGQLDASVSPVALDQFYGQGFYKIANGQFLPLTSNPLPVKFLDFSVAKKDRDAVISWAVENEDDNTDKYIVERSVNGNDFKPVETVAALNNGRSNNTYTVTQRDIASLVNSDMVYYKVKQIDKGGKFVYTATKNLKLGTKAFGVKANPTLFRTSTTLTIDLEKDARLMVSITDANGKQIKNIQLQGFKGTNIKELNLDGLAAGSYMVKVNTGDDIKTLPIVKSN